MVCSIKGLGSVYSIQLRVGWRWCTLIWDGMVYFRESSGVVYCIKGPRSVHSTKEWVGVVYLRESVGVVYSVKDPWAPL